MLQNATPLRKSALWPPNISGDHVSCTAPATRHASFQILFTCPTPANMFETATKPYPKGARTCGAFSIFTSKRASRHNGVQFFIISTSKSGPTMLCFVHFGFDICFAPQRCALFQHLIFQECSDVSVCFVRFYFEACFEPQTACNCSSLISPDGSAPPALASLLFHPQNIRKTQCFATCLPSRAPASPFFWLLLFSNLLSTDSFSSLTLRTSGFSSAHIVGSLPSKVQSIIPKFYPVF